MRRVAHVQVLSEYRLELTFDTGERGTVSLAHLAGRGVFAHWNDYCSFERVSIGPSGELIWGDAVDLCPDSLYLQALGKRVEDLFPAVNRATIHA
ncbi:MAG: DUF2442 domain-containing protein [Candidatus Hydrogenedentales bacterium]|jgi:hypothetical protein